MLQQRLFVGAPETIHSHATWVAGAGWHLTIVVRLEGEQWPDSYRCDYDHLSTPELFDVISEELAQRLRL